MDMKMVVLGFFLGMAPWVHLGMWVVKSDLAEEIPHIVESCAEKETAYVFGRLYLCELEE